jgi:hypothetical protein
MSEVPGYNPEQDPIRNVGDTADSAFQSGTAKPIDSHLPGEQAADDKHWTERFFPFSGKRRKAVIAGTAVVGGAALAGLAEKTSMIKVKNSPEQTAEEQQQETVQALENRDLQDLGADLEKQNNTEQVKWNTDYAKEILGNKLKEKGLQGEDLQKQINWLMSNPHLDGLVNDPNTQREQILQVAESLV